LIRILIIATAVIPTVYTIISRTLLFGNDRLPDQIDRNDQKCERHGNQ
jgi:hypothetical protein